MKVGSEGWTQICSILFRWMGGRFLFERNAIGLKLNLLACCFDELAKLHAGWTGRFAGSATNTAVHMLDEIIGNLKPSFCHCLHLVDTPTGGVHLHTQNRVGWAGGETEAAMDALAHQVIAVCMTA